MSKHCEDCGSTIYSGLCPNCQELEYIQETQPEYVEFAELGKKEGT